MKNSLNDKVKSLNKYLIVSDKNYPNIVNQFVLKSLPINIFKLVEKINIEFLKLQFNSQSEIKINNYTIDLNSREIFKDDHPNLSLQKKKLIQSLIYQNQITQLALMNYKKRSGVINLILKPIL